VATIEPGRGGVCPECGAPFELTDLRRAPRPGDWTVARGLKRGVAIVLVRSLVAGLAWMLLIWTVPTVFGLFAASLPPPIRLGVIVVGGTTMGLAGGAIGWAIARAWAERAGFASVLVAIGLIGWSWLVIGFVADLVHRTGAFGPREASMLALIAAIVAGWQVVRVVLLDD